VFLVRHGDIEEEWLRRVDHLLQCGSKLHFLADVTRSPAKAFGDRDEVGIALFGPDAVGYNPTAFNLKTPGDFSLKDTYVELKAPVGNGLDFKLGTFTELNGYEVFEAGNNPNYTRSYGYMIEPTQLTGALAAYQLTPALLLSAGIADTWNAGINSRANPPKAESFKTYMGAISFTCPTNCGFLSGSTLLGAVTSGYDAINGVDKTSLYAGATFNTPIKTLKVGLAHDYVFLGPVAPDSPLGAMTGAQSSGYQQATGIYLNWQATEKLSFNTRGEYFTQSSYLVGTGPGAGDGLPSEAVELTETVQYQLWKNVVSRRISLGPCPVRHADLWWAAARRAAHPRQCLPVSGQHHFQILTSQFLLKPLSLRRKGPFCCGGSESPIPGYVWTLQMTGSGQNGHRVAVLRSWPWTSSPRSWSLDNLASSPFSQAHALKARQHISPGQHPGKAGPALHPGALKGRRPRQLLPPLQGGLCHWRLVSQGWADVPARRWRCTMSKLQGQARGLPESGRRSPGATGATSRQATKSSVHPAGVTDKRAPAMLGPPWLASCSADFLFPYRPWSQ